MNLEARKISLVQEFLRINDEKTVIAIENFLQHAKSEVFDSVRTPMSIEEFNAEIDESLDDEKHGRLTKTTELLANIERWQ